MPRCADWTSNSCAGKPCRLAQARWRPSCSSRHGGSTGTWAYSCRRGAPAAGALRLANVVTVEQAYRSIHWTTSSWRCHDAAPDGHEGNRGRTTGGEGSFRWWVTLVPMRCWPVVSADGHASQLISNTATALIVIRSAWLPRRNREFTAARVDVCGGSSGGIPPHCDADQSDGDGPRRIQVR